MLPVNARWRTLIIVAACSLLFAGGCGCRGAAAVKPGAAPADMDYIGSYDVLAAYFGSHTWGETEYAFARIRTPASPATKGEAEVVFFAGEFGERVWTNHYFRSRPVRRGELKRGMVVFFTKHDPAGAAERMREGWLLGVVAGTEELVNGYVSISLQSPGMEEAKQRRKSVDNLRVPLDALTPLTMPK